jgi:hypothetical protein
MARTFAAASSQATYYDHGSDIGSYPSTVAAWFYPSSPATNANILAIVNASSDSTWIGLALAPAGSQLYTDINSSGGFSYAIATASYTNNAWNHAAVVLTSSTSRTVYLGGGNSATDTTAQDWPSGAKRFGIGALLRPSQTQFFEGRLAEVCWWNVALAPDEIAALAAGAHPLSVRRASIINYWPLYGVSSPEPDISGALQTQTLYNSPTQGDHAPVMLWPPRLRRQTATLAAVTGRGPIVLTSQLVASSLRRRLVA